VEAGEEVVGAGGALGEVGEQREDALAVGVDLDLCAERAHAEADSMEASDGVFRQLGRRVYLRKISDDVLCARRYGRSANCAGKE